MRVRSWMARVSVTCLGHWVSSVNATRVCCSLPVGSVGEDSVVSLLLLVS